MAINLITIPDQIRVGDYGHDMFINFGFDISEFNLSEFYVVVSKNGTTDMQLFTHRDSDVCISVPTTDKISVDVRFKKNQHIYFSTSKNVFTTEGSYNIYAYVKKDSKRFSSVTSIKKVE